MNTKDLAEKAAAFAKDFAAVNPIAVVALLRAIVPALDRLHVIELSPSMAPEIEREHPAWRKQLEEMGDVPRYADAPCDAFAHLLEQLEALDSLRVVVDSKQGEATVPACVVAELPINGEHPWQYPAILNWVSEHDLITAINEAGNALVRNTDEST